ncbi:hypothetical protein OROMI_018009 [Orobanche minor]
MEPSKAGSKEKEELVCLYPFTKSSNTTQRKIKQQYDQLVKSHGSKGLTLDEEMLQTRSNLLIAQLKDDLLHLLEENNIVVISGETCCGKTTQDAQNKVAAFALHHLFPGLLVHFILLEPYASFILKWKEDLIARTRELFTMLEDEPEHRSTNFVDSLLSVD